MAWGRDLAGERVAITGASSGIGEAVAEAFAAEGCHVALSARRLEKLEEVAGRCRDLGAPSARADRVDVTDPDDVQAWAGTLSGEGLDVVVANAGVGQYGRFLRTDADDLERVVETNLLGVWRTVHALADLLEAARGQAIVVGSMISRVPIPYMSAYHTTKAALRAWTRAVRPELSRRRIALTLVEPGMTRTAFGDHAVPEQGASPGGLSEEVQRGWPPERVAERCLRAARWRPKEVPMTLLGRIGGALASLVPNLAARALEPTMRPEEE